MHRRTFLKAAGVSSAATLFPGVSAISQSSNSSQVKIILWCWDARMTWDDEPSKVSLNMAASEKPFPYPKAPGSFGIGFRRLIDYSASQGIHAIVIWGFLRESHGGVAAAQDLCKYARDKGVSILPGAGLCSYGGYFFEGSHPYNLGTYLRDHPDRVSTAQEEGGGRVVTPVLDPSLPANQQWWREGLEWMLDTFEIGGINFEMGDFVVNQSPQAVAARAALGIDADGNVLDMIVATRALIARGLEIRPDGLFINALYRGAHQIKNFPHVAYTQAMPEKAVWEYTLTGMVRRPEYPDGFMGSPKHRQYGYLHWFNLSTKTQDKDYVADIARVFPGLHSLGYEFAGTYGELSAHATPVADRNYRAQAAWGRESQLRVEDFS